MMLRPRDITSLLAHTIPARVPVLLVGSPGLGKSALVNAACADAGADLITTHPAVEEPTNQTGFPFITPDGNATFVPFGPLRRARAATRPTVWFADDLGQATPATQASYMPLFDAVRGHNDLLGDGAKWITFVAATNRRTERAGASGILEPVKNRFAIIAEMEPHIDDWCPWAFDHGVPAIEIAFLRFQPDLLSKFEPTADLTNSPTCRGWEHVANIIKLALPPALQHVAISGAVGEGAATQFAAFERTWAELPNIDQILIDPMGAKLPTAPGALYAVATALACRANATTFGRIAKYLKRMIDASHAEFAVLCIRDACRRDAAVMMTDGYIDLATKSGLGKLLSGE